MGEPHKHCFTYCGDDRCDCPAREAFGLLGRVSTALPVLSTMLHKIGAAGGARLASEMHGEVSALTDTKGDRPMGDR